MALTDSYKKDIIGTYGKRYFLRTEKRPSSVSVYGSKPEVESKTQGIFGNTQLLLLLKMATCEKVYNCTREKEMQVVAEKEEIINRLKIQLTQRDNAINHLEELVMMQQKALEENLRTSEGDSMIGFKNAKINLKQVREVTCHNEKRLNERKRSRERNKLICTLSKTVQEQNMQLESMQRDVSTSKEEDRKSQINKMKQIIQDLQLKLQEKSNTNFALIRSIKLQNETISDLRSANMKLHEQIDVNRILIEGMKPDILGNKSFLCEESFYY
jgi:hypothetical protein